MLRALVPASLALAGAVATSSPAAASPASVSADLRSRIHRAIATSTARTVSVAVDVDGLGAVYRQAATTSVLPASTEKLLTTFTALQALGAATRLSTELRSTATQRGPYLEGDLYLVAAGDPFLTSAQLDALAAALRTKGIRKVTGRLLVDDTRYDTARRAPGWKTAYVPEDSGPLSALALDRNAWRRDAAYIKDPSLPALSKLREMLTKHGVSIGTAVAHGRVPATATAIASHASATVTDLVRRTAKESDNFAAELLLKEAGKVVKRSGTSAAGAAAVRQVLSPLGVTVGTVVDGSGLSAQDRQTAAGELSLLAAAQKAGVYADLRRALPIACQDGTLKKRMCSTAAAGKAIGKTGTLPGVNSLTGWTTTADGHTVRYAILLTGVSSGAKARAAIDQVVVLLSGARAEA